MPKPAPDPATVTVAHFAPFSRPRSATSVSVRANGAERISNFKFGQIKRRLKVDAGGYLLEIVPTGTDIVAISDSATIETGKRYFMAAIGGDRWLPLELFILAYGDGHWVKMAGIDGNGAYLRIVHLAFYL